MAIDDDPGGLLRCGLLEGRSLLLAHAPQASAAGREPLAGPLRAAVERLGARLAEISPLGMSEEQLETALAEAPAAGGRIDVLVVDVASLFAAAEGPRQALMASMDGAWGVTRTLAASVFLGDESAERRGGRVLYVAPPASAGAHSDAVRAGVENLARTLSIEWSRFGVTAVAIAPGEAGGAQELALLIAYLASPAGAYFSGCLLDLRGP